MLPRLNRGLGLAALTALFLLPAVAGATPLATLLQLAEQHDSDFLVQESVYAAAREASPVARAQLMPQLSAQLSGEYNAQNQQEWRAGISLEQPLYNLPRYYLWQAAQQEVTLAAIQLEEARETLRRDVILAWLDVQLAADTLRLVEKRHTTLEAQLKRTRTLAAVGQVVEADVLSARAGLASAASQLAQAKHDLATAHDSVIYFSGAAAAEQQLHRPLPPLPPLDRWLTRLDENNLLLKAARQQSAIIRRRLQSSESAVLPRLSLSSNLNVRDNFGNIEDSWQLSLQQSLFTGGGFSAERRRLIAESDTVHGRVAAQLTQLTQTLRRLHGQMRADIARQAALTEAATSAEALLRAVTVGYENGVNIITEVLDAEADVFDARLSQRQAAYSYLQNLTRLRALIAGSTSAFAGQIEQLFILPEEK